MCRITVSTMVAIGATLFPWKLCGEETKQPPQGPFGFGLLQTSDGAKAELELFLSNDTCATCHERQFREFQGSLHTASHLDPLYRQFAELARREAGDKVYAYCASCHAPTGVVTGLIPAVAENKLPAEVKAGVTCDTCHQISQLTGAEGPWKQPGNASFVLQQGKARFGHSGIVAENRLHTGEKRDFFAKAEFCASCHTVIHPVNGLRIEETYEEWKNSIYGQRGIVCQDCHMRSVEDAVKVAESLRPVTQKGPSAVDGPERDIFPHYFVGGNADADRLAHGPEHARMAEARLKSAARIELRPTVERSSGRTLRLEVTVHNIAAGHNLPTGVTELRQMWVDLRVADGQGRAVFRSGELDQRGDFGPNTIWFGAVAADAAGKATFRPWEMKSFLYKRTIPPKGTERETISVPLPEGVRGPLAVEAKLLYRSAPPHVVSEVMGKEAYVPKITEMASARANVSVN